MSLWKMINARWGDGATDTDEVRMASVTNSLQTVDYAHHEIHEGDAYFIVDSVDLSINNVYDMQFTTPNTTKWIHFTFTLDCEAETEWFIYEGVTVGTPGTKITPLNHNRNVTATTATFVSGITNTSVANANSATAVSASTQMCHGIVGAGRNGGNFRHETEYVLKQGTKYCFRAIATAAGNTSFVVQWYEHANRH